MNATSKGRSRSGRLLGHQRRRAIRIGVDEFAIGEIGLFLPSLFDEAVAAIHGDGALVVGVGLEIDANEAEPLIGEIEQALHEQLAGAAARELVVHGDAEPRRMAPLAVAHVQAGVADDATVELDDEHVVVAAPAAVEVGVTIGGHGRRVAHHQRLATDVHERRPVVGADGADDEMARGIHGPIVLR